MTEPNGYDEHLFRLLLAEFVRRHFNEGERKQLSDIRGAITTPVNDDIESDHHESLSIIVIPSNPLPRPYGPARREADPEFTAT